MTETDVSNIVKQELQKSQYRVSGVPYHTHNGIDSPKLSTSGSSSVSRSGTDASRTLSTASGTQTIAHKLGVTPTEVRIIAMCVEGSAADITISEGVLTSNGNQYSVSMDYDQPGGTSSTAVNTNIVYIKFASGQGQSATAAVDAHNITLTWTKIGAGVDASVVKFLWIASA